MFFMLAFFIFNNSRCFDDHLLFGWKILKNSSILTLLRLQ